MLSVLRRKAADSPWVGLLARKGQRGLLSLASPSPAERLSGLSKRRAFTYSGGTAPDSHRTSLLGPSWAPKAARTLSRVFAHTQPVQGHRDTESQRKIKILRVSVACKSCLAKREEQTG